MGEQKYSSTALDKDKWSASRPGQFTPKETSPSTH
jgi:hypothetical protein